MKEKQYAFYSKILVFFLIPMIVLIAFFYYEKQYSHFLATKKYEKNMADILLRQNQFIQERLNGNPLILSQDRDKIKQQFMVQNHPDGVEKMLLEISLDLFDKQGTMGLFNIQQNQVAFFLGNMEMYNSISYSTIIEKINKEHLTNPFYYNDFSNIIYIVPLLDDEQTNVKGYVYTFYNRNRHTENTYLYILMILFSVLMAILGARWVDLKTNFKINQFKKEINILRQTGESIPISNDRFGEIAKSVNDLNKEYSDKSKQNKAILDSLPFGVIFYGPDGQALCVNETAEKITGFSRTEIKNFTIKGTILEGSEKVFWKTLRSGESFLGFESFCPTKDGREIPVVTSTKPIIVDEYLIGTISTFIDVSEQQRLRKIEQNAKVMLDHISDGVITIDTQGNITSFNKGAEEMTGYYSMEVMGRKYEEYFNTTSIYSVLLDTLLTGKEINNLKKEVLLENSERTLHLIVTTRLLINDQGQMIGAMGIYKDITPVIELEQQVLRTEKLAVLGELAAGTAHEIRNPLTTIQGFIQLIGSNLKEKEEKEYIKLVLDEIQRINEIIKEMLLLTKPSAPQKVSVSINKLVQETISLMMAEGALYDVHLQMMLEDNMPIIEIDDRQIKQVFINIIRNGIQAMKQGGKMDIKTFYNQDKNQVEIDFIDYGEGIAPTNLKKIYEPFFTTKEEGTGLGLPVSVQIMNNHGGELNISSQLNKGTTVSLNFPI